jgi:hypothetical protein
MSLVRPLPLPLRAFERMGELHKKRPAIAPEVFREVGDDASRVVG